MFKELSDGHAMPPLRGTDIRSVEYSDRDLSHPALLVWSFPTRDWSGRLVGADAGLGERSLPMVAALP